MKSYREFSTDLREALIQLLWDQWVSVGVAGGSTKDAIPFIVDPEALLLTTTTFLHGETRLRDEVMDWLLLNGKLISLQRLKNLHRDHSLGDAAVLSAMARIMVESRHPKWNALLHRDGAQQSGSPPSFPTDRDFRGMSQKPDPRQSANFLFRMRSFFGMNARAEVFAWLLTHEAGYSAAIARETGWFSKTVQLTLNELEQSGLIFARAGDREKVFRLQHEQWRSLLPRSQKLTWFPQAPFYEGCREVLAIVEDLCESGDASDWFRATVIRQRLSRLITSLEKAGLSRCFSGLSRLTGTDLIRGFEVGSEILRKSLDDRKTLSVASPLE